MVATVKVLSDRATDDVLELFDLLMVTNLMPRTERESRNEKLRRYPRVSRHADKLSAAVKALLEMSEVEPDLSLNMMWDLIENTATKSELRAAVALIDELVPVDDTELNGQRLEELAGRLATVWVFLPRLMQTVTFGATADGAVVLAAMKNLGELMSTKSKLPATWLDSSQVDHDLIGGNWKRPVYRDPRPPETVDCAAYTLCLLEQFHRHLKYRNIFAPHFDQPATIGALAVAVAHDMNITVGYLPGLTMRRIADIYPGERYRIERVDRRPRPVLVEQSPRQAPCFELGRNSSGRGRVHSPAHAGRL